MKNRKILSLLLALSMLITMTITALPVSAQDGYNGLVIHYIGADGGYDEVGIVTISGGQFADGSWYKQLNPDGESDVIVNERVKPGAELNFGILTSNWGNLASFTIPASDFDLNGGNIEAWYIYGTGLTYTDPNGTGTPTTSTTQKTTTTTEATTTTTTTKATTVESTSKSTTGIATTSPAPQDGYYKLVINSADSSDVGMIVVSGCESKLANGEPSWWQNYTADKGDVLLTVYVKPSNTVELSFLTSNWGNLSDATIPAAKFASDTLNIWYKDGEIYYSDPGSGGGTTTQSTTTTTQSTTKPTTTTTQSTTKPTTTTTQSTTVTTNPNPGKTYYNLIIHSADISDNPDVITVDGGEFEFYENEDFLYWQYFLATKGQYILVNTSVTAADTNLLFMNYMWEPLSEAVIPASKFLESDGTLHVWYFEGEVLYSDPYGDNDANTQKYDWDNVEIVGGGYTSGIEYSKIEEDLVYARTDIGGAYRMDKITREWIPLTDSTPGSKWGHMYIQSMMPDPVMASRVYILVGAYTNGWDPNKGALMRSDDYGDTWTVVTDLPFHVGGNEKSRNAGERIAIDPNNNNIVYIGSQTDGLYKSTDAGVTFNKVSSFTNIGTYKEEDTYVGITWIVFDSEKKNANGTTDIYVGVGDKENSIYCSKDAGSTWSAVAGQPTTAECTVPMRAEIANNTLYMTFGNKAGPYEVTAGAVYKYDLSTGAWTDISPKSATYFGYGGLSIDAQDTNVMAVSTIGRWGWKQNDNIFYTTDGGQTWVSFFDNDADGDFSRDRFELDFSESPWLVWGEEYAKLGWMMGDVNINPFNSDELIWGTGATIYFASNLTDITTNTKVQVRAHCKGIEETAVLYLAVPETGDVKLYSAMGDIDGFSHKDLTQAPPNANDHGSNGNSTCIEFAWDNPSFVVRGGGNTILAYSTDAGDTWTRCSIPGGFGDYNEVMIAVNTDGSVIMTSNGSNTYYSTDRGSSWITPNGLPNGATVSADRVNKNIFYAFTSSAIYISNDAGKNFTKCSVNVTETTQIRSVPGHEGEIMAAGKNGLYRIYDMGNSADRLTNKEIQAVGLGAGKTADSYNAIYAAGTINNIFGIFRSDDLGETWIRINDDEHQWGTSYIAAITGDPNVYGRVFLATNGRGIIWGEIAN